LSLRPKAAETRAPKVRIMEPSHQAKNPTLVHQSREK
jgi:hypothetical protein